jgi:uncharacterized protein YheU (UPF0270 family)
MRDDEAAGAEPVARGHVGVDHRDLEPETLQAVIADIVTRDGTDYGAVEKTLEQKVSALMRQLERGEAKLVFDVESESIGVMTPAELARAVADAER